MVAQSIVWTTLPNGMQVAGARKSMRISVLVSPRLDPQGGTNRIDPTFPDFDDWAKTARGLAFAVEINGGPTIDAKVENAPFDSALWAKVFRKGDVPVVPFKFKNMALRALRSYPVRSIGHHLRLLYRDVGTTAAADHPQMPFAPGAHPALVQLADDLGGLVDRGLDDGDKEVDAFFGGVPQETPSTPRALPANFKPGAFKTQRAADFYQADRFYRRPEFREAYPKAGDPPKPVPASPKKPELDFHQLLAGLADHPQLMRRLGIVIDLLVPVDGVPAEGMIRVIPRGGFRTPTTQTRPWTHYRLDANGLFSAPRGQTVAEGFLRLEGVSDDLTLEKKVPYDVVTLDPDGSALKALHFALSVGRLTRRAALPERGIAFSTAESTGLPALQSNGVALVENIRAMNLGTHLIRQASVNGAFASASVPAPNAWGDPRVLHAEDLLRGFRPDVQDLDPSTGKAWRSLMRRVGDYTLAMPAGDEKIAGVKPDEGYVKAASTSSKDAGTSDLYLHETLFKWTGWSLAAPPPGRTIEAEPGTDASGNPIQRERVRHIANESGGDTPLEVEYRAEPGTLPRLRFGHTYRVRARTADLAGNSLPPDDKTDAHATVEFTYRRWEPVLPPALLPQGGFGEGASLERMVVRSNYDVTVANYAASVPVQAANAGKHYAYGATDDRHVVPPKVAQIMAETHGAFDPMFASGPAGVSKAYRIAAREAGHYMDTKVVDVATGDPTIDVSASLKLLTPPGVPASPPPPTQLPLKKPDENDPVGETLSPGQYVVYPVDKLHLPYLPDPIGRGVAFRGLPNVAGPGPIGGDAVVVASPLSGAVAKLPWKLDWPEAPPFRIVLRERPGSMPAPGGVETLACQEVFTDPGKPVWDPAKRTLTVFLGKAESARIRYSSFLDKADVELLAVWRWLAGGPNEAQLRALAEAGGHWMLTPFRELEIVHAVQQPLCIPRIAAMAALKDKVGDTHAFLRSVLWRLSAKSTAKIDLKAEWQEWLDDVANPEPIQVTHTQHVLDLPIGEAWGDESVSAEIGQDRLRHEFVDTHFRLVSYHLVATTRFREYFPEPITRDPANITRIGPQFKETPALDGLRVPNSARPAAPKPLYVVPTFKWLTTRTPTRITSRRIGRGLRVWLERPWYSSGDGELLGVVIDERAPPGANATGAEKTAWKNHRDKVKPYVTEWGKDPLFASANPKTVPAVADFPLATKTQSGLTLDEIPGTPLLALAVKPKKADLRLQGRIAAQLRQLRPSFAVAGHEVRFDKDRRLWYADLELNAGSSYWPFVRLALARYQPESRGDCHLSRVVLAEFAQILPDRSVEIAIAANQRTLTVDIYGAEPSETGVGMGLKTDPVRINPVTHQPILEQTQRAGLNEFEIEVEFLDPALGEDFGWKPLPGVTVPTRGGIPIRPGGIGVAVGALKPKRAKAAKGPSIAVRAAATTVAATRPGAVIAAGNLPRIAPTWSGSLVLPQLLGADKKLRLVVREFELHYEDAPGIFLGKRIARRLVYADTIALT